jgi:hypothetical protein
MDNFSQQAEAAFRSTDNPWLLARARSLGQTPAPEAAPKKRTTTIRRRRVALHLDEAFRDALTTEDRARIALSVVAKQAHLRALALYLIDGTELRRYDDGDTTLLPADADDRARAHLSALLESTERTEDHDFGDLAFTTHTFVRDDASPSSPSDHVTFTVIPLVLPATDEAFPVAVIVLAHDITRPPTLTTTFLHALAHALHTAD